VGWGKCFKREWKKLRSFNLGGASIKCDGGVTLTGKIEKLEEKSIAVPLYPTQIPHMCISLR
jgi:hypothetical protein